MHSFSGSNKKVFKGRHGGRVDSQVKGSCRKWKRGNWEQELWRNVEEVLRLKMCIGNYRRRRGYGKIECRDDEILFLTNSLHLHSPLDLWPLKTQNFKEKCSEMAFCKVYHVLSVSCQIHAEPPVISFSTMEGAGMAFIKTVCHLLKHGLFFLVDKHSLWYSQLVLFMNAVHWES